jgi:hypothetical protein
MAGHTPRREIKRKSQEQNGSRLGGHRKIMPFSHWMYLLGLCAAIVLLDHYANAQDYEPYKMGTGLIVQQAELCFAPDLSTPVITLLNTWQQAVDELEAYERGGTPGDPELALAGQLLYDNHVCATVAAFYHIAIISVTEGYVLAKFDEQHGFEEGTFIVAKKDILPDRAF